MSSARFRPARAGIINLWDYRDQEFSFADGRLVLRGPNGSGKTKALEVLFPFVLDGRIEPRRLNPFAGEERTMRSNLLYQGQESAHSYVWMEFSRGQRDDPEAVTVGIGMRATKGNDKVTRWHFVVDGRVGVDFSLLDDEDRPLTKKQLIDQVGADAITERPIEYRAAIDARMFGLGAQRYDQLINLILTLRRPQLAKNLDPKGLSQALTDGLRPLDDELVVEAARSFSDMEEVARTLESLAAADDAAQRFVAVYSRYVRQQARVAVEQVSGRLEAVDAAVLALRQAATTQQEATAARTESGELLTGAERELEQARTTLEALQRSSAYEGKQQLDDLASVVANLERTTAAQTENAARAQTSMADRRGELTRAEEMLTAATAARRRAEDAMQDAAGDASITWPGVEHLDRTDRLVAAIEANAEERDGDVRAVRSALSRVEGAAAARTRAEAAATRSRGQRDTALAAVEAAETVVELARGDAASELRRWWAEHMGDFGTVGLSAGVFEALDAAFGGVGEDDAIAPAAVLAEHIGPVVEEIRFRRRAMGSEIDALGVRIGELEQERAAVAAERDDAPPPFPARCGSRDGWDGAPLWQLVRFRDEVSADEAGGVEAALQAANLLDGWLVGGEGAVPDLESEQVLVALPPEQRPAGRTLADVLVPESDTSVPEARVAEVLASIALTADLDSGLGVAVDTRGGYRQGVQLGRHVKDHAEFIGATARARRRQRRIAELDASITEVRAEAQSLREEEQALGGRLDALDRAVKALPRTGAVLAALRKVTECAGALRTAQESAAAADRDLDQAIADAAVKEQQLRAESARHRTPLTAVELDSLDAAIRHFRTQGQALLRALREQANAAERVREAQSRHDEARVAADDAAERSVEAAESLAHQQQRLETLRESIGASAERIDAELADARGRIESAKAAERAARNAFQSALEQIGKAEAAHTAAEQTLRSALVECQSDARKLAPFAHRDLLALLDVHSERAWPASEAAWLDVDHLVYRIRHSSAVDGAAVETMPVEVMALFRSLETATESVSTGESARKSTGSALTSALQDFDAELARGRDYRLTWDAPDGVTVVQVQDEQGYSSVGRFAARIAQARQEQEALLTDSERRILEDALLTGLSQQIHERTVDARDLIGRMGSEMRQRHMSSGTTIGVHWVLADHLDEQARAVCKLLDRDASVLSPEDLAGIRAHFASRIRAERAAHPERSYPEILASTLDYRRWRVFSFSLIGADGSEDRLTPARHSALSGGEQSVSLHLPLFAAAHVMLDSADPHAPRLLALDEAFAGVDDTGRSELLGLCVQFDLDLFMTGFDLWITYAGVPGCAHYDLSHSVAEHTVAATLLVWSGGELLAEHDGSDLASALGSPGTRRVRQPVEGSLEFV
ncbi:TIGR02680 family protein [Rhodococcus sp. HNM0563]|uniref:TIGR02680 family protein n=1 Tax=Rhodococcus sp. HNM0563 TaxID=2716339 RepID=UPI00146F4F80|nr:TIGR02680 family protein [Rhodococcus sp. HNM0563]NLU64860.1 TIGR02680 family protein [Rhodococcus sp. HNM0563]